MSLKFIKMEKICCIIDIQGFNLKTKFIPREFAIVSENFSFCTEINPGYSMRDFTSHEREVIEATREKVNGLYILPFNEKNHCYLPNLETFPDFLIKVYNMVASEEKPLVGVKNDQTMQILQNYNIPIFNLSDVLPPYRDIQAEYGYNYLCGYHKRPKDQNIILLCAYRKAAQLYRKVKESIIVSEQLQMQ